MIKEVLKSCSKRNPEGWATLGKEAQRSGPIPLMLVFSKFRISVRRFQTFLGYEPSRSFCSCIAHGAVRMLAGNGGKYDVMRTSL